MTRPYFKMQGLYNWVVFHPLSTANNRAQLVAAHMSSSASPPATPQQREGVDLDMPKEKRQQLRIGKT